MKRAVSISIGSSKRDKAVEINILGEQVRIERIGTDGDMEKAAQLFKQMDGQVDAFGLGGADLGIQVGQRHYLLHSVSPIVRYVKQTPLVDGAGLKNTLEADLAQAIDEALGDVVLPRQVLITMGVDRHGMMRSFVDAGYECTFGDLMFGLGIPIALHSERALETFGRLLAPVASRLPFEWLYPTGDEQDVRKPKWEKYYQWATVIAGDCHYVKRHMPDHMQGKVIVTNTTTPHDVELFRSTGVSYLVTSTPVLDGRSFGTNMMEAALVAASGAGRPLEHKELAKIIEEMGWKPQIQKLD
jgi:hypothetical protein